MIGLKSSRPKILFLYESSHQIQVKDGLWTALDVLESTFEIKRINIKDLDQFPSGYDFVLGWGAFGSGVDRLCQSMSGKKGLCIGGNVNPPTGALNYDVLFYETKWYRPQIDFHPNIIQAFGYNAGVFQDIEIERDIDYLGVGAFATWKRWEKFLDKKGSRRVVGEFQFNNPLESRRIWEILEDDRIVCKDMVTSENLVYEYNRAKTVYIPSDIYGGGERAILEARACGCRVEVEEDNPKLKEVKDMPLWTHLDYSKKLKEAISKFV